MKQALVVDDHPLICQTVGSLLQTHFPSLEITTSTGANGVLQEVCRIPWAFVVLDISLPDQSGLHILKQARACCARVPIIIYSAYADRQFADRALRAGAIAYVSKENRTSELVSLVRQILDGNKISRPICKRAALSVRERQVLTLLAKGMRRTEIAHELNISGQTVSAHQANLLLKLDLRNVVELVRYALEEFGESSSQ